ncbi:MAG TPA: hypothetical protein ENH00_09715 [Actinobacteria bacterium]|nr:hypothetical protein [Actinomycetota bacterium]
MPAQRPPRPTAENWRVTNRDDPPFVLAFGVPGRSLVTSISYERGFGLRAALDVIYPITTAATDAARLLRLI